MALKVIFRFQQAVWTLKTISDPNTPTPTQAVVPISQPDSDSDDDVPLSICKFPKLIKNGSGENNSKEHMWKNVSLQKTV